jgi:hypothetical protein
VGFVDPSCEPEKLTDPMIGEAWATAGKTAIASSADSASAARTGGVILEITPITPFRKRV